jgi:hypothetical protein
MPLLRLLVRPLWGFEADCHGLPHCIQKACLVSTLAPNDDGVDWVHHPLQSVMALIASIVIGNGLIACCCLLQL